MTYMHGGPDVHSRVKGIEEDEKVNIIIGMVSYVYALNPGTSQLQPNFTVKTSNCVKDP